MSIGATQRDLVTDVLKSSGKLLVPGLAVGPLLAAALARLTQAAFVGVNVLNPLTYLSVVLLQTGIVAIACVKAALRAASVDPVALFVPSNPAKITRLDDVPGRRCLL